MSSSPGSSFLNGTIMIALCLMGGGAASIAVTAQDRSASAGTSVLRENQYSTVSYPIACIGSR